MCKVEEEEGEMSRSMAMGLVLFVFILTSQNEWKQHLSINNINNIDLQSSSSPSSPSQASNPHHQIPTKRELPQELIILSQEKHIFGLNELVKTLQRQLAECHERNTNNSMGASDNQAA